MKIRNFLVLSFTTAITSARILEPETSLPSTSTPAEELPQEVEPRQEVKEAIKSFLPIVETRQGSVQPKNEFFDVAQIDRQASGQALCNGPAIPLLGTSEINYVSVQIAGLQFFTNCVYRVSVPANSQAIIKIQSMNIDCSMEVIKFGVQGKGVLASVCPKVGQMYKMNPESQSYIFEISFISRILFGFSNFQMNLYLNATSSVTPPPPKDCKCGVFDGSRIVGGFVATKNAYPYQVGIYKSSGSKPFCGGTLISPNYVLTAGHCTAANIISDGIKVSVGDSNYEVSDGETFINVVQVLTHPEYSQTTIQNDFALLRLQYPAQISSKVGVACLPPDVSQNFAGANLTISGWGTVSSGGLQSPNLKAAYVTALTNDACRKSEKYANLIKDNMICATAPGTDACQGDSGGPLVGNVNGKVTLVGVTSFGIGCANPDYPGVYARVTSQKPWILANSDAGLCQN